MEFGWNPAQESFRAKVEAFLAVELPDDWELIAAQSPGSKALTEFSRKFCPKLASAGLLVPHWPAEFGGNNATPWEHFILGETMWAAGEPRGPQYYNVNWIGPSIMQYGSDSQKQRHLMLMSSGNVIWCQGFSEPSAGSDLAALSTRAEKRGSRYVINGAKIWTSYASLADYCFLLTRVAHGTSGMTVFMVPMNCPGITVRAIRSVVGDGDLHEVVFHDVEVGDEERLGAEGAGWQVAGYALHYERVGIPRYALAARVLERSVAKLRAAGDFGAAAQEKAARAYAICEAARLLVYEVIDMRAKHLPPTAATSVARYSVVQAERIVAEFVLDFVHALLAGSSEPLIETHHRRAITAGIAAGAAEIQLNLIARMLFGKG